MKGIYIYYSDLRHSMGTREKVVFFLDTASIPEIILSHKRFTSLKHYDKGLDLVRFGDLKIKGSFAYNSDGTFLDKYGTALLTAEELNEITFDYRDEADNYSFSAQLMSSKFFSDTGDHLIDIRLSELRMIQAMLPELTLRMSYDSVIDVDTLLYQGASKCTT